MSQERRSPNQRTQLQNDRSPTDDPLPLRERVFSGNSSTRTHDEAIASLSIKCSQLFEQVQSSLSDRTCQDRSKLRPEDIEDQAVRFKLWAGNLGAFHKPQSHASIEHRVRQSPKVVAQLRELLDTLSTSLRCTLSIALGDRPNRQADFEESNETIYPNDESDFVPDVPLLSEVEESFELAKVTITSLFRIAILIRTSTSRDRFTKASFSNCTQLDPTFEIQHVREKFPLLTYANCDWLNKRLGVANAQRRGYLAYIRDHQQRLELLPSVMPVINEEGDTSTINLTTASTFVDPTNSATEPHVDDNVSEASSAMSSLGTQDDSYVHPPSLASVSKGSIEFKCPLCRLIQRNLTERSWKKHMYEDLRPYICTFEDCDLTLFPDPTSWIAHEAANHRSRWHCPMCTIEGFPHVAQFRTHVQQHIPDVTDTQIDALSTAARSVRHIYSTSDCPFCDSWKAKLRDSSINALETGPIQVTSSQYKRHVGSHMRQLALFVIPREYMGLDQVDSRNSDTGNAIDDSVDKDEQRSKGSSRLEDDRPDDPSTLSDPVNLSTIPSKDASSSAREKFSPPPYIFRIDEIGESPDVTPSYDKHGIWHPSIKQGGNVRLPGTAATGIWWYCNGRGIQRMNTSTVPPGASHFQTFSVYYSDGFGFWVLRGDATNPPSAAETWHPLSFDWDERDCSSYLTITGEERRLRCQRSDQKWPHMLLPVTNQLQPAVFHQGYGGLKGDLAIFLALLALSVPVSHLAQVLPQLFVQGAWGTHPYTHGRTNQRGVVVYVCTGPDGSAKELQMYQDGVYGKYYP